VEEHDSVRESVGSVDSSRLSLFPPSSSRTDPSAFYVCSLAGPLNGRFPLLSLRTNKAEVIVGLAEGVEERMDEEDPKWRFNGKWAVVSFAPLT